ncbi:MAG: stage II sporulation protein M, partial [Gemmatimonadales bacterium]
RFTAHRTPHAGDDEHFLADLYQAELARRSGRFGARRSGAARGRTSVAEQLVARKSARWSEFQALTERTSAHGLDALKAGELADFAARYREVAADLARARTYHADATVIVTLQRLVAAGHNALYRGHRQTWRRIWTFLARDCPAEIVASWRYVAIAFLVFTLPAAAGFALLRERPALAPSLLPDVMLERAEAAASRTARGEGYVDVAQHSRPLMATSIIVNNVHVAFSCFASGIALGFGSLVALAYNGLELGATSGYFDNMGVLGYLWTFVAGHGLLELFSIWVAGAAGFLLGRSIIAPGDLPRRDAVVLAGRRAIRMLGAVVVLLCVAGTIEGFVSSSGSPLAARLAISAGSVLLLLAYLLNGARWRVARRLGALSGFAEKL